MKYLLCHIGNFTVYLKPFKDAWYKKAWVKVAQNMFFFKTILKMYMKTILYRNTYALSRPYIYNILQTNLKQNIVQTKTSSSSSQRVKA